MLLEVAVEVEAGAGADTVAVDEAEEADETTIIETKRRMGILRKTFDMNQGETTNLIIKEIIIIIIKTEKKIEIEKKEKNVIL